MLKDFSVSDYQKWSQSIQNSNITLCRPRTEFLRVIYRQSSFNDRVKGWSQENKRVIVVMDENGERAEANEFYRAVALSFDQHDYLYVIDLFNHRVQRFSI